MGGVFSSTVKEENELLSQFGTTVDLKQFHKVRSGGNVRSLISDLNTVATDIKGVKDKLQAPEGKTSHIICNNYTDETNPLGSGPLFDCITTADYLKHLGFTNYYIQNPTKDEYLKQMKYFLESHAEILIVYYSGRAESVVCSNGDPQADDGKDEALDFVDGKLFDEDLAKLLSSVQKPKTSKIILLNEFCHSGNPWDIKGTAFNEFDLPANILVVSTRRTTDEFLTSDQSEDAGLFTFYLFRTLNDHQGLNLKELESKLNHYLAPHKQYMIKASTTPKMFTEPLLPVYVAPKK
ncbi:Clan CD, family C14, metacaspase-like cysteine peptidase [Tritrichomonas foetus]|uniref:Clan CD, family C14, metacaspase-like cysteine peptidase n=1 Tax=Tritrichomonas foetus TaxID=1144522 RepID=A0A1J4JYR3_9EUKA|nr:Clan CD, family C14, metacaspase-like cysteine peptidase [Tritrichomonas foetus]|eukprot:OHT02638.1 Clan CD, family C14, metacaspase-like cysteine peptidase [Tritrichomonas foetus]